MRTKTAPAKAAEHSSLHRALSHPLRLEILRQINRGIGSPKELSDELSESLGVVSYHVRTLEELGCIELADTKFRRGAVQHFYRPLRRAELNDADWAAIPESLRTGLSATMVEGIIREVAGAMRDGSFDARDDRHVSLVPLELTEDGWTEVNRLALELLDRAMELQAEAASPDNADEPKMSSTLAILHFERAPKKKKS